MPIIPTRDNPNPYGRDGIGIPKKVYAPKGGNAGYLVGDKWTPYSAGDEQEAAKAANRYKKLGGQPREKVFAPKGGVPGFMDADGQWTAASAGDEQATAKAVNRYKAAGGKLITPKGDPTGEAPTPGREQSGTGRNVSRGGATGTQTGIAPARFDGTEGMDEFMSNLTNKYGISFGGQDNRGPMQSSNLPKSQQNVMSGIEAGQQANATNTPVMRGVTAGMDADRAASSKMTAALADQEGMRAYMDRAIKKGRENASDEGPMAYATDGLDARSRAFLDYEGSDSLMALRAADAAQDTVYAGGKLYDVSGKNKDGKYSTINSEMRGYLRDNRNDRAGSQSYKDYYQKNVVEPRQAENSDTMAPTYSSRADYQQLSQRDMEGTLVMGAENKPEPFENNVNRSYITGSPGQDIYNTNTNPFVDQQEPPTTGFLPDEDVTEEIKRFYLK